MALAEVISGLTSLYGDIVASIPAGFGDFLNIFIVTLFVVAYSVFMWKFSRLIGTKNIFELNLNQYNRADHPLLTKLTTIGFYLLEYILILPALIFFWFSILTIFLILFTEHLAVQDIIIISATVIAAIRMTSYIPKYGEKVSREIAKLIPLNLLAISLLYPGIVDFERVLNQVGSVPGLFSVMLSYLTFIIGLEMVLRFFDFLFTLLGFDDQLEAKKTKEEKEFD